MIKIIKNRDKYINDILSIWENSVIATHCFLTEADIVSLKPLVEEGIKSISKLIGYFIDDKLEAFIGVEDKKIEMLFASPKFRGKGIGKQLILYAIDNLKAIYVDVNEQNIQAVGFYEYMGFKVFQRDDFDGQGNPFPILHMKKEL